MATPDLLRALLRDVSRSFYWTLRVLPGGIRRQLSLAYLLARATDTIADTRVVPVAERLEALERLRDRILGDRTRRLDLARLIGRPPGDPGGEGAAQVASAEPPQVVGTGTPAERALLARVEEALELLEAFDRPDRQDIRAVLTTITSGQALDLGRFAGASAAHPEALATEAELDDYIYRVAGCVGEFWTRVCRRHLFPQARLDDARLLELGVNFGKGLQLVNVLRDLPRDLRDGRCYLPADVLEREGLTPAALLDPDVLTRFRGLYDRHLDRAARYLADGWTYTNTLPRRQVRVRLACAWPVLIGVRTLALLRVGNPLDPVCRIKVSRPEIRSLMLRSVLCVPWPGAWTRLYERAGAPSSPAVAT